jgi:hypothetical protein
LFVRGFFLFAQDEVDSMITINPHPFFERLVLQEGKLYPVSFTSEFKRVNIKSPILKSLGFEVLKLSGNKFYLHFYRSGKIYKLDSLRAADSSLIFKRIDHTWNYNYNIGSNLFSVRNDIYEIGGYGFWKSNGVLRKFNYKDKEWDVVVLDREVFPHDMSLNGNVSWIDSSERYFYVPFQRVVNDGILEQGDGKDFILEAYRLDVSKNQWEYLGSTHKETFKIFRNATMILSSAKGLLVSYTSRVYHMDFTTNKISVVEDASLAQSLSRLNYSFIRYYNRDWVYWYNNNNQLYDSIYVDKRKFVPLSMPVWEKSRLHYYVVGSSLLLVLLAVVINRRRQRNQTASKKQTTSPETILLEAHPFNETELTLLTLLVEKTEKGATATISEINYVLGIKDKNPGMQKKVRSDVINSINGKFKLLHKEPSQLIQSIRSEADKRYFEYLINPDLLSELQKLIG